MAIPPVTLFTNIPGGMRGIQNALNKGEIENEIKRIEAQYAPLTAQANAKSKMAYANLMEPQYLAKLMGNEHVVANLDQNQREKALDFLYRAGSGQGTGNQMLAQPGGTPGMNTLFNPPPYRSNSLSGMLFDVLGSLLSKGQGQRQQNQLGMPPSQQPSPQVATGGTSLPPPINQGVSGQPGADSGYAYDRQGNNMVASPQEVEAAGRGGMPNQPIPTVHPSSENKYAKNVGTYKGLVKQGEKEGEIRATDINELNNTVYNAQTNQNTLDDINTMISSPEMREIRQIPLAGRHEMGYYAKQGTPQQQQLIGRLFTQMGNIVKDSSRDFAGQFRKGEQQLLQGMKPNDSDTVDVMIGKAESLSVMNRMIMERARLTSQYMRQFNMDKLQASERADKELNGNKIRQQVHDQLNPMVTIRNRKTGEKIKVPVSEARKRNARGLP